MKNELISIFPELVLSVSAMILLMMGVCGKKDVYGRAQNHLVGITKSAAFALLLGLGAIIFMQQNLVNVTVFNHLVIVDSFAIFTKTIIIFSAVIVLLLSQRYLTENAESFGFEYPVLIILSVVGMFIMVSASDMLTLYIGLELQSLALYVIAASRKGDNRAAEAGIKYFVLGALASGILLYGISLIYGYAGSTNFVVIATNVEGLQQLPVGIIVGLVLVLVAMCFKLSAAPFHMWAPDVYEGVPTPVTAFFAIVPKLAAAALIVRLCTTAFGDFKAEWQQVIMIISIISMIIGAFAGIWQKNIKRLLAYSSIGHIGYALMGIAANGPQGSSSLLTYFVIYILNSIGIFAIIMAISVRDKQGDGGLEKIEHFAGLNKSNPVIALVFTMLMVSMIGLPIPPFAGFWGKFYVFSAAINEGLYALAVIGVISSVVAAYYYLYLIKVMYFDKLADGVRVDAQLDNNSLSAIIAVTILSLAIFIRPELLTKAADIAASSLY